MPKIFGITSVTALRCAWQIPALRKALKSAEPIFTFGTATTKALKNLRLKVVKVSASSSEEFGGKLTKRLGKGTYLGLISAQKPAFALDKYLRRQGWQVQQFPVYKTDESLRDVNGKKVLGKALAPTLLGCDGVVCFASPSAVRAFARVAVPALKKTDRLWLAVCIGKTTAKEVHRLPMHVVVLQEAASVKHLKTAGFLLMNSIDRVQNS